MKKGRYLCANCRMFIGEPQVNVEPDDAARFEFGLRLRTRARKLGGTVQQIRETVKRELEGLKK